jgi:hypothetical protein
LQDARLVVDDVVKSSVQKDFVKNLLTTTTGFAGCDSYKIYGLPSDPKSDARLSLPSTERAGLLTHPAFLAGQADFQATLPIKRGRFVNESLLCREVPDVPIDVVAKLPETESTVREKLAEHSKNPRCAACHTMLDPMGLALEQYDAFGRYRTTEHGKRIDASGQLTGAAGAEGPFKDGVELAHKLASSVSVERCVVRHGFQYFMGRPETDFDACAIETAASAYRSGGGDFAAAVTALFTSDSFLQRSY